MKYFYLFVLITFIAVQVPDGTSELNDEQGTQIDCLIITTQDEERGVINKADGLIANTPYYIGCISNDALPMARADQFVKPVLKFGIPGKEPEYTDDNESLSYKTRETERLLFLIVLNNWQSVRKKNQQNGGGV